MEGRIGEIGGLGETIKFSIYYIHLNIQFITMFFLVHYFEKLFLIQNMPITYLCYDIF